jgi:hypothetical protein
MNESSASQPPLPQGPPSIPHFVLGMPPDVKLLAILHLVFAGLSLLAGAWSLVAGSIGNPFERWMPHSAADSEQLEMQKQAQSVLQEKIMPLTITHGILSLIIAAIMIIAAIKMLRKRRDGLKWSNAYAWSSLGEKVIQLYFTAVLVVPATREMMQSMMPASATSGRFIGIMDTAMAGGAFLGVLVTCVYPIVCLVMLNRGDSKAWFESLPK